MVIDRFVKNNKQMLTADPPVLNRLELLTQRKRFKLNLRFLLRSRVARLVRKCFGKCDHPTNIAEKMMMIFSS